MLGRSGARRKSRGDLGEEGFPAIELGGDICWARGSNGLAGVHGFFHGEEGENFCGEDGGKGLIVSEGELGKLAVPLSAKGDGFSDDFVGLAKGDAVVDEVVGEIGGEQHGIGYGLGAGGGVGGDSAEHGGEDSEGGFDGIDGIEDGFFVFLHIAVVGHGQTFEGG